MDAVKLQAITSCGRCGQPEDAHKFPLDIPPETVAAFAALGGPCTRFVVSDAAVIYQQHIGLAAMAPRVRRDGRIGKRSALCGRCGQPGHRKETCPF